MNDDLLLPGDDDDNAAGDNKKNKILENTKNQLITKKQDIILFRFAKFYYEKKLFEKSFHCYLKLLLNIDNKDNNEDADVNNNKLNESQRSIESISFLSFIADGKDAEVLDLIGSSSCPDYRIYFNLAQLFIFHHPDYQSNNQSSIPSIVIHLLEKVIECNPFILEAYANLTALHIKQNEINRAVSVSLVGIHRSYQPCMEGNEESCRAQRLLLVSNLNVSLRKIGMIFPAIRFTWKLMFPNESMNELVYNNNDLILVDNSMKKDLPLLVTVICVKVGTKYSSDYVNHLHQMISRSFGQSIPDPDNNKEMSSGRSYSFRLICLTDDPIGLLPEILVEPIPSNPSNPSNPTGSCSSSRSSMSFKKWWSKVFIFSPEVISKYSSSSSEEGEQRCFSPNWLFLDLDTIVLGDILSLWTNLNLLEAEEIPSSSRRKMFLLNSEYFQNEKRPLGINSSLMLYDVRSFSFLFTFYRDHCEKIHQFLYKFDYFLEMLLLPGRMMDVASLDSSLLSLQLERIDWEKGTIEEETMRWLKEIEENSFGYHPPQPSLTDRKPSIAQQEQKEERSVEFLQDYLQRTRTSTEEKNTVRIMDYFDWMKEWNERKEVITDGSFVQTADGLKIICFPLIPKPHQLLDRSIKEVQEYSPEDNEFLFSLWNSTTNI